LSFPYPGPRKARPEYKLQRESNFFWGALLNKLDARFRGHDRKGNNPDGLAVAAGQGDT